MSDHDHKTILVIDDDDFISKTIQVSLEKNGYKTISAANGAEGLEIIQAQNPALVICDRNMPKLSGYQLLKSIRNEYPEYNKVPFVFLTSLDDRRDKMAAADLNPTAYLTKPVDLEELLVVIKAALAN